MKKKKKRNQKVRTEKKTIFSVLSGPKGKLALLMLGIFLGVGVLYFYLVSRCVLWVSPVLYTLAAVLFLVFFFVNRGFSRDPLTPEQLPADWPQQKKEEFCADDAQRKEAAKKIMIVMVPILLIVAVDMLYMLIEPLLASV